MKERSKIFESKPKFPSYFQAVLAKIGKFQKMRD